MRRKEWREKGLRGVARMVSIIVLQLPLGLLVYFFWRSYLNVWHFETTRFLASIGGGCLLSWVGIAVAAFIERK